MNYKRCLHQKLSKPVLKKKRILTFRFQLSTKPQCDSCPSLYSKTSPIYHVQRYDYNWIFNEHDPSLLLALPNPPPPSLLCFKFFVLCLVYTNIFNLSLIIYQCLFRFKLITKNNNEAEKENKEAKV